MLPQSAFRNRHKNRGRPPEKSCHSYLQWLRGRPCALEGASQGDCGGKIHACHVDYAGDKGMGTKVSDHFSIPMCTCHHAEQHNVGWETFEKRYRFRGVNLAEQYFGAWLNTPMGAKWIMERENV